VWAGPSGSQKLVKCYLVVLRWDNEFRWDPRKLGFFSLNRGPWCDKLFFSICTPKTPKREMFNRRPGHPFPIPTKKNLVHWQRRISNSLIQMILFEWRHRIFGPEYPANQIFVHRRKKSLLSRQVPRHDFPCPTMAGWVANRFSEDGECYIINFRESPPRADDPKFLICALAIRLSPTALQVQGTKCTTNETC
jgi:hypothetical protein